MRLLGPALLLPLAACFSPNPKFIPGGDSSGTDSTASSTTGTTTPTTTGAPDPTSTSAPDPTSTTGETTGETTVTSEPVTSTTLPILDMPGPACTVFKEDDQVRRVSVNGIPFMGCGMSDSWIGALAMGEDGDLSLVEDPTCMMAAEPANVIHLGKAWPTPVASNHLCAKATVFWTKVGEDCQIGALRVIKWNTVTRGELDPLYLASLSYPTQPSEFPIWPTRTLVESCGCPGEPGCCVPEDAGEYVFDINGLQIGAGAEQMVEATGKHYLFKNIQSYVGPGCLVESGTDARFDWFARRAE